jgi:hypothetical protein
MTERNRTWERFSGNLKILPNPPYAARPQSTTEFFLHTPPSLIITTPAHRTKKCVLIYAQLHKNPIKVLIV